MTVETRGAFVRVEETWLRAADVSYMKRERGHSYSHLKIVTRDGHELTVSDYQGNTYDIERALLAADEASRDSAG